MSTTPLEREILTHYWTSPAPFPRCHVDAVREAIERFVGLGLLSYDAAANEYRGVKDALRPYMEALDAVPLPVQRWVVPPPSTSAQSHSTVLLDSAVGKLAERLELIEGAIGRLQAEVEKTKQHEARHTLSLDNVSRGYGEDSD
ncbi:MAG TPA: hypothetical protein VEU94_14365 [Terriglobales bacterium]|nr:hypothetical protein [Terriglobales bacterium]